MQNCRNPHRSPARLTPPKHGYIYPINCGYIPDTFAPDGHEIDTYVLGVFEPIPEFEGICIAVIKRLDDDDDKVILVPEG